MAKRSTPRKKKTPVKKKAVKKKAAKKKTAPKKAAKKPVKKAPVKKALLRPPSSSLSLTGSSDAGAVIGNPCQCEEGDDGMFYCYKRVQGRWVACRGPFTTGQECVEVTNERCV